MNTWYDIAYHRIAEQRKELEGHTLQQQQQYCQQHFPFGPRIGFPYDAWKQAMKSHFEPLNQE